MAKRTLGALLVLLPLTLGLRSAGHGERLVDYDRLATDAAATLQADGWSVRLSRHHLIGQLVEGNRAGCRILVHFVPPEGTSDGKFRILARPFGPVDYSYRGQWSRDFPRLTPMLAGHAQRYAWSLGLAIPTAPLVATARSAGCGDQHPDYGDVRQHLRVAQDPV